MTAPTICRSHHRYKAVHQRPVRETSVAECAGHVLKIDAEPSNSRSYSFNEFRRASRCHFQRLARSSENPVEVQLRAGMAQT